MEVNQTLKPKFQRLENLRSILENNSRNHTIPDEYITMVTEAVKEGLEILSELMSPRQKGKYDIEATRWLIDTRVIFKEVKADLCLPWNMTHDQKLDPFLFTPPPGNKEKIYSVTETGQMEETELELPDWLKSTRKDDAE